MGSESTDNLRIIFFPYPAAGHFYPMLTMAHLFSTHPSVSSVSILTTPSNSHLITKLPLLTPLPLPLPPSPLPSGWDSVSSPSSLSDFHSVQSSLSLLRDPLRQIIESQPPHCLVSDMFLPWTAAVSAELGVPRIVFHGMSCYSLSVIDAIKRYEPHKSVVSDEEVFVVPRLPRAVRMTRANLPSPLRSTADKKFAELAEEMETAESVTYGVVINSVYEIEKDFADHYRKTRRAWFVCLKNRVPVKYDFPQRAWLDSKPTRTVIYVCFGSQVSLLEDELTALAAGLAKSKKKYSVMWVTKKHGSIIRKELGGGGGEGRFLVVEGWAPQVEILGHGAVGGFVTHCGWNSVLESVMAGKAMVTVPVYGDQLLNEKMVVEEMGIGVKAGLGMEVAEAVERVMGEGEEAEGIRERARKMGEVAGMAVEEGGSSEMDLDRLVHQLLLRALGN